MFTKKVFFNLVFLLTIIITSFTFANNTDLQFKADKKAVNKGEKVCFIFKNNSNNYVVLPNSAPWVVISRSGKDKGKVVYAPVATLNIVKVPPNDTKKWCWDLKNFDGNYVHSGKYEVRLTIFVGEKRRFLSTEIEVKAKVVKLK